METHQHDSAHSNATDNYLIRRKVFKLLGAAFHIYDMQGNVLFYSKQKAFNLNP